MSTRFLGFFTDFQLAIVSVPTNTIEHGIQKLDAHYNNPDIDKISANFICIFVEHTLIYSLAIAVKNEIQRTISGMYSFGDWLHAYNSMHPESDTQEHDAPLKLRIFFVNCLIAQMREEVKRREYFYGTN